MDHTSGSGFQSTATQKNANFNPYIEENGNRFMVPYHMIKRVTFTNVSKEEMIDIPHAARLQYRLLLLEPIIKASVDFIRSKITVIYNNDTSDNNHPKISFDELREVLLKEGVTVDTKQAEVEDYDYHKNFYSYAYNSPSIRETVPYGYTQAQWAKLKPAWEEKVKKGNLEKVEKHREFQNEYLEANPDIAYKLDPTFKPGSRKVKKGSGGKGFWFHGI